MARLNDLLDRLPRSHVVIGDRAIPTYLACGIAGSITGTVALVALTALAGRSLLVALGLSSIACATFVAGSLLRRRISGLEDHVLLREVYTVLGAAAAVLAATGNPVLAYLDLMMLGLCVFLAFGRIGCSAAGCCHGVAAQHGFLYPPEHPAGQPRVRRFPVQLIESAAWLALTLAGAGVALRGQPGQALSVVLVGYGIVRIALETWRGDPRPHWLGFSFSSWFSLLGIAGGLALYSDPRRWTRGELILGALALVLVPMLHAGRRRWLSMPAPLPADLPRALDDIGQAIVRAPLGPDVSTHPAGDLLIGASLHEAGDSALVFLSASRRDGELLPAEAEMILEVVARAMGAGGSLPRITTPRRGLHVLELVVPAPDPVHPSEAVVSAPAGDLAHLAPQYPASADLMDSPRD